MPQHFRDKERVAISAVGHELGQLRNRITAHERRDQTFHLRFIESTQRHPRQGLLTTQVREHFRQRMRAAEFAITIGAENAEVSRIGRSDDVPQHEQCRLVCPM